MSEEPKHITLFAYLERIRAAIESPTLSDQWLVAEVSTIQVNGSGHCYIELAETTAAQQMPRAVCRAVIWASRFKMIAAYFRHDTGSDIMVGMKILVKCTASYHAVYGLSLVISDIDPTYTVGEVERVRHQTIARLQKEGVFDMNRELDLPPVIQRIAIISSSTAAGYGDFMNEIERSPFQFDTTLFPAMMQGTTAHESIIAAMDQAAQDDYDALIIIRGGGSASDLSCFDNFTLCANIAQFPMPVITGIGHDRDVSVADMVACLTLKTPTAVATHLIEQVAQYLNRLEAAGRHIIDKSQQKIGYEINRVETTTMRLNQITNQNTYKNSMRLQNLETSIKSSSERYIQQRYSQLAAAKEMLGARSTNQIEKQKSTQQLITQRLKTAIDNLISQEQHRLEIATSSVRAVDPQRILKLGYAIINNGLKSIDQVNIDDELTIKLQDGIIKAKTYEKWQKKS